MAETPQDEECENLGRPRILESRVRVAERGANRAKEAIPNSDDSIPFIYDQHEDVLLLGGTAEFHAQIQAEFLSERERTEREASTERFILGRAHEQGGPPEVSVYHGELPEELRGIIWELCWQHTEHQDDIKFD